MKTRIDINANYKANFFNGKTIRRRIDPLKTIGVPQHAEIEDIAINSKCFANCDYCYTSATKNGVNFENIVQKALDVWGSVDMNSRPFQIAIGGAGESTIHPDFPEYVKTVKSLGIMPNYTTNGMHLTDEVIKATIDYCGGVAISYHPHIKNVFHEAIKKLSILKDYNVKLNTHIIVGDKKSLVDLKEIYYLYKDNIDYFVILPYQAVGRAISIDTSDIWKETFEWINSLTNLEQTKFAFGALFYEWMLKNEIPLSLSIYEPEIYSGYRMMDDSYKILRKSSYNLEPKQIY